MILVDTSIWVDHLRSGNEALSALLNAGMVLMHPFVAGELALGDWPERRAVLGGALGPATFGGGDERGGFGFH